MNNTLLDGNTTNTASTGAISFVNGSYGSVISGNTLGNTPGGGGLFTYGVQSDTAASGRSLKDLIGPNNFLGLPMGAQFYNYFTSAPTNGFGDISQGDYIANATVAAGAAPGWYCVATYTPALTANASSSSKTVTCGSTTGMANGDLVALFLSADPVTNFDYSTAAQYHIDTIASVTDGTKFVLTTGIQSGVTFVAGTASIVVARLKAAAVLAS